LEVTKKLNDAWNQTKNSDQSGKVREQALQRLDFIYQQYLQLKANLKEGIEFYTNIQEVITKFKRKCEDLAFARQTEKQELVSHLVSSSQGSQNNQVPPPSGGNQPLYIQQNQPQFPPYNQRQPPPYNPNNAPPQNRYAPFSNNQQPPNNNQRPFQQGNQPKPYPGQFGYQNDNNNSFN